MNKKRSFLASLISVVMVVAMIPSVAFAATVSSTDFVDMPNDWSTDALEKAVSNGLISGFDEAGGKYIKPASFLTRAQMATIVNRAFGAENQSYLSGVQDVPSGEWYAKDMAKAVGMGTFMLSSYMRPNDPITRQEAFTVLARAFKLTDKDNGASLYRFTDGVNVASYAKSSVCAMIDAKYVAGSDGYLYPNSNISRAEFAKVMDNLVKHYCDTSGETFTVSSITGNVMINEPGVTIKNTIIRGDLIVGDGVGSGNVILDNVDVTGRTIIRGGGLNSIRVKSTCDIPSITIAKIEGNVRILVDSGGIVDTVTIIDGDDDVVLEGEFGTVTVNKSLPLYFNGALVNIVQVNETTTMTLDEDTEIDRITVDSDAVGTKIINNGLITKLVSSIKVTVSGSGTVTENLATGGTLTLTGIGSIIGTAKVGSELEAGALKPSGATATYQWKRASTSGGTYTNISGATSKTYTPVAADLGRYLKVTATGKSSYTGSVTSTATAAVAASKITATTISGVTIPAAGAAPDTSVTTTSEYTATITWSPNPSTFVTGESYTATIRLTPKSGYTLTGITANQFKVAGATATNPANSGTITAVFPAIGSGISAISATVINGVTVPVTGAAPDTSVTSTTEYTATITWIPNPSTFEAGTAYTAVIILTPKTGYTLTGVTANQFTVPGASSSNSANSGVITAVFPATSAPVKLSDTSITISSPRIGATPIRSLNTTEYTASVSWDPSDTTFEADTVYAATIVITPKAGYTLTGITENEFTVSGAASVTNAADSGVVTAIFDATPPLSAVTITEITGVTAPETGAAPDTSVTSTDQYTATISWDLTESTFAAGTVYTATITLTPKAGYTLSGILKDQFTVSGIAASNAPNSGEITVVFPATL